MPELDDEKPKKSAQEMPTEITNQGKEGNENEENEDKEAPKPPRPRASSNSTPSGTGGSISDQMSQSLYRLLGNFNPNLNPIRIAYQACRATVFLGKEIYRGFPETQKAISGMGTKMSNTLSNIGTTLGMVTPDHKPKPKPKNGDKNEPTNHTPHKP